MQRIIKRSSLNWGKELCLFVLLALVIVLMPAVPSFAAPARMSPVLARFATERPDAMIGVIVQKSAKDNSIEEFVAKLGGTVMKDLWIINAFAAEVPASSVPELAKAAGVKWISLDAPTVQTVCTPPCIDTSKLKSNYPQAVNATKVWNLKGQYLQGQGIAVAVVDSGINVSHPDLLNVQGTSRVVASVKVNSKTANTDDYFGHGTHVAGIIGGNGKVSGGAYIGVAPQVNLVNVKISDDQGNASESDLVAGLQWVYQNHDKYNIRVVNLSINSSVNESYHTNPIDAACEVLWFNKIVVVVASGNAGWNALYPPANDPFVITVGATNDWGTVSRDDDTWALYSTFGKTNDGFAKPDLVAPGNQVISLLPRSNAVLATAHPDHLVSGFTGSERYFRMSGTSMSAPIVAGGAALLLQSNPNLTPDQVKYRLTATAFALRSTMLAGSGELDIYAAVTSKKTQSANTGMAISKMLTPGANSAQWTSLNWDSLNWDSLNWDSLNWDSLNWDSLNWDSIYWGN
ncbi:MAG: S8 family peptidase [Chloroflexi bacterium]|nr:S8 family peptidase [Chloroflexota bacterium]